MLKEKGKSELINLKAEEIRQYISLCIPRSSYPQKNFLIVCDYRSGSTLLANLINQHPDIYCDDEIFIPFVKSKWTRVFWPYGYLQGKRIQVSKLAYGFDCKVSQIMKMGIRTQNTAALFFWNLHCKGWKFIYLKRLNIVRQSMSSYIATARQQWHDRPSTSLNRTKVYIDTSRLSKAIETRHKINAESERLMANIPHLPLIYEQDLLSSTYHRNTMEKVCDYLAVKPFYHETNMNRISSGNLSDDISNFDEVIKFLSSSPYAQYMDF